MERGMAVDRCVCHDVTFADVLSIAEGVGRDLDAVQRVAPCGTGCGTCVPYLIRCLHTGESVLPVLSEGECQALLEGAGGERGANPHAPRSYYSRA